LIRFKEKNLDLPPPNFIANQSSITAKSLSKAANSQPKNALVGKVKEILQSKDIS
jgi:hypothetical protein